MADLIITPSLGKIDFIHQSAQAPRVESIILHEEDGLVFTGKISASSVTAPLNVINVTAGSSNVNYPFIFADSGETGPKSLLMDSAGGTYNPSTNTATIDISGNSATTTLASNSTNLGGVAAASYVTLTGTQTLTNKTITGTFTGNLTGTGSWATNAVNANTATNSTQLNGQAASYYTNIPARLGYTPVNQAGDTISGNLTVNGNFAVNGSITAFSASNIYITSSNLTVTDNILLMNALSPYQRYAGIQMYDSGSGTLSQLLWDGEGDYFFLTGSSVNGKIITGPDGQTNLTSNFIPKATAGYKLGNSLLYDNGTSVGIGTTTPAGGFHINNDQGNFSEVLRLQRSGGIFYSIGLDTNFLNIAYNGNTNASNIFVLKTNGFLGLGNLQNANYNLDIASTQGQGIQLRYDTTTNYLARISPYWNSNTDTRIDFAINRVSGTTPAVIMSVGYGENVGIGTTAPVSKLQVNSTTAGATLLRTDGTNGTLFSVVDDLSDSLMSVNNSAGLPVLEVFADDRIVAGQYGQNDFIVKNNKVGIGTNNPVNKLTVSGSTSIGESYINTSAPTNGLIVQGNVGIGTTSTGAKLEVKGIDDATITAIFQSTAGGNAAYNGGIQLGNAASSQNSQIYHDSSGDNTLTFKSNYASGTGNKFVFSPGGTERVRFQQNGKVGIGTTVPTSSLHIKPLALGADLLILERYATQAKLIYAYESAADGYLEVRSGADVIISKLSGYASTPSYFQSNVGIGITLPTTPLHVVGVISGSSFSGAGTGLTGTAANLTAGTVTTNANLTGDVTSVGNATTIANDAVTTVKILNANVTNAKLANSSVTIGSTAVSLGATATTFAGLTSVTSTTFVGSLTGTGSWATNAVTALNGGVTSIVAGTSISISGGTGAVTVNNSSPNATHTGDVTGATTLTIAANAVTTTKIADANVTNAKLANSSITIGSTAISLGGTTTLLPGLTSITSTTVNATNVSASATGSFGIVGVNTTTPAYKLDVNGSFRTATNNLTLFNDYIYVSPTNNNTLNSAYNVNGIADMWINFRGYNDLQTQFRNFNVGDGKGSNIAWFDGTNRRLSINNGQSASYTLDVVGDINFSSTLKFGGINVVSNAGGDVYLNGRVIRNESNTSQDGMYIGYNSTGTTNAHIRFFANATNERMRIQANDGNVGIGTTSAGQKLDVEGRIRTRGATGTGGFEIGAATTGTAKWRIEWDSASDSLDFNWVG